MRQASPTLDPHGRVMRAVPWQPADWQTVQAAAHEARLPVARFIREATLRAARALVARKGNPEGR